MELQTVVARAWLFTLERALFRSEICQKYSVQQFLDHFQLLHPSPDVAQSSFLFNTKLITEGQFEMSLGIDLPVSILFSITISFILMALYNIQDYIENPFDQKGLDDLQIDQMQIFENESLYE